LCFFTAVNPTDTVLNISCYKFVPLPDAAALRDVLHERAVAAQLKGTILLAEEGINFFLAGPADAVRGFVAQLRTDARFADWSPRKAGRPRCRFARCWSRSSARSSAWTTPPSALPQAAHPR